MAERGDADITFGTIFSHQVSPGHRMVKDSLVIGYPTVEE